MHDFELYGYGESVASNMARVALAEKKITYKYNVIYLESKGEHLTKEYQSLNPKTFVPTLLDNGKPIPDSIEIMRHIDNIFPDTGERLFPSDPSSKIQLENILDEIALREDKELGSTFGTVCGGVSMEVLANLLCKRPLLKVIWDYATKHPDRGRAPKFILVRLLGKPPTALYKKFVLNLANHILTIEDFLSHKKDFMLGETYSAADCCMASLMHRINEVRFGSLLESDKLPNLRKYWKIISSRPSYKEGIIAYQTGEWAPEIEKLYGNGPNTYNDLLWSEINKLLKEK